VIVDDDDGDHGWPAPFLFGSQSLPRDSIMA
jgi:hypothetical protein